MGFNNTMMIHSILASYVEPSRTDLRMKNGTLFTPNQEAILPSFGVNFSGYCFKKQHSSVLGAVMMNCSISLPDGNLCFQ